MKTLKDKFPTRPIKYGKKRVITSEDIAELHKYMGIKFSIEEFEVIINQINASGGKITFNGTVQINIKDLVTYLNSKK